MDKLKEITELMEVVRDKRDNLKEQQMMLEGEKEEILERIKVIDRKIVRINIELMDVGDRFFQLYCDYIEERNK